MLRVDEILFKQTPIKLAPSVRESEPFSSSQCFLDELKKDLIPAYEIFEPADLIIAANKLTKKYTFSNSNTSTTLFEEGIKKNLNNNLQALPSCFVNMIEKEIRAHVNYHPIRSLFLLHHLAIILEDKIDEQSLAYICQNICKSWELPNFKEPWLSALATLYKKNLPFKLINSYLQLGILWSLCIQGQKHPFLFKKHQKNIATLIPVISNNDIIYLLIPIDFNHAKQMIKEWEEKANDFPEEAAFLLKYLSGTSFSPFIEEKKNLISFLLSLPIPKYSIENLVKLSISKETSFSKTLTVIPPQKNLSLSKTRPSLSLRLLKTCRKKIHLKTLKNLIEKDKNIIYRKENTKILQELIDLSPSILDIIKEHFLSLTIGNKTLDQLCISLSLLSSLWKIEAPVEVVLHIIDLLCYLSVCQTSKNSTDILKELQINASNIFSYTLKKDKLLAFRFLIACHLCKILPQVNAIDHKSVLQILASEKDLQDDLSILLSLPYQTYWQKFFKEDIYAVYKKIIQHTPWKEAVRWIRHWTDLDPLAFDDEVLLSPLKNETLDPAHPSSLHLLNEIFTLIKNRDISDRKPSLFFCWIEKKLTDHVLQGHHVNTFKLIYALKDIPQIENLKMISLLVKGYLRHGICSSNHKEIFFLMTSFRSEDMDLWQDVIQALLKSRDDIILKDLLHLISENEKLHQLFYKRKHNFWQQIIGYFLKNREPNFKFLFESGFDLLAAFDHLKSNESLIAIICPLYFRFKNLEMKNEETANHKLFDHLYLLREKCLPIFLKRKQKNKTQEFNNFSQACDYPLIVLALKLGEENYLNIGLTITLSLLYEKVKVKNESSAITTKYLQPLILALSKLMPPESPKEVQILSTPNITMVLKIIAKILTKENPPELLAFLLLSYLSKEMPPPHVLPEVAFLLLPKILSRKITSIGNKECHSLFSNLIARMAREEFFGDKQTRIFEIIKEKFINPKILIDKSEEFLLGTALCQEFKKYLYVDLVNLKDKDSSLLFRSTLHLIFMFVLHNYNSDLIRELFSEVLLWQYKIADQDLSTIKSIYIIGKGYGIFDKKDNSQLLIHATCKNIRKKSHKIKDEKHHPIIIKFLEKIAKECHPTKCIMIIDALKNYSFMPINSKIPIYIKLLEKVKELPIKEKMNIYIFISNLLCDFGKHLLKPTQENSKIKLNLIKSITPSFFYKNSKKPVEIICSPLINKDDNTFEDSYTKEDYTLLVKNLVPAFFGHMQKAFSKMMENEIYSEECNQIIFNYINMVENIIRDLLGVYTFSKDYALFYPIFKKYYIIAADYIEYLAHHQKYIGGRLFKVANLLFQQITPENCLQQRNKIIKAWMSRMVNINCDRSFKEEKNKLIEVLEKHHIKIIRPVETQTPEVTPLLTNNNYSLTRRTCALFCIFLINIATIIRIMIYIFGTKSNK